MKFRVYKAGSTNSSEVVDEQTPEDAARFFITEFARDETERIDIVVEPADNESKALDGWLSGARPVRLMMFTPTVEWMCEEGSYFEPPSGSDDHG